ncbi:MAG: 2-phosphosulfolactate phosphatase [Pseudodesulfovibrio sp.]|uniref:Probable 2-phosphosulfolactate phosphatase n=1 Tax=Pseudodesulfovibrio aespoeensis (strain ATCC 700646 / DSM 10631 / Aspo-2) TaxID=643562 RepID=E6VUQ8_PSEA9|nr:MULTISPECIES: 2-phosphosulfolactate phosphatase [Pseudodesulfovibrio]MBU4474036.1 2-phosphosulfolactate phosphatase [Pseudomonadota bacterium]ADU62299.1 2-phosphosulfolactate phosphatase [Pseudodesulfovibrio aespoeensis Aspo-2]MBU4515234.1 2-phosphosulfolactate phosphatase [Pseudomonadota bacterium]MBU4521139.1 2-phosphosulfolactate phosphatase [Pseudomonadota bacterium]MBU4559345.1 2-phosphosulfolactate phosphatase [Pseudomonadota bacterium]
MIVNIAECLDGARRARGVAVVIDVFRAFSVACYAVDNGAQDYLAAADVDLARRLAGEHGGILMGERDCIMPKGFDYGNSPTEIEHADFSGRTVVHTTSAGTQGLLACTGADEVLTGSFVNAGALVEYLRVRNPEVVTLVAMGTAGVMRAQEDMMCAMYLKNALEDYPNSFETLKSFLAQVDSAQKFFDPEKTYAPERDFELCMALDRFDFVLRASPYVDGAVRLERVLPVPSDAGRTDL